MFVAEAVALCLLLWPPLWAAVAVAVTAVGAAVVGVLRAAVVTTTRGGDGHHVAQDGPTDAHLVVYCRLRGSHLAADEDAGDARTLVRLPGLTLDDRRQDQRRAAVSPENKETDTALWCRWRLAVGLPVSVGGSQ